MVNAPATLLGDRDPNKDSVVAPIGSVYMNPNTGQLWIFTHPRSRRKWQEVINKDVK